MPGPQLLSSVRRHGARSAVGLFCTAMLVMFCAMWAAPAGASGTDNAQLSLTGLVDDNNPTGGSSLGVRPDTTISFTASAAPTQKIKDMLGSVGLGSLVNTLLSNVTFQVKANFSGLPGGHKNTILSGNKTASFHFSHTGTYYFTYEAQKVTAGLLGGTKTSTIELNGNQANKLGVELNASNAYQGEIDVTNTPHGGISVQLPRTKIHPKILGHSLPKVTLPGVTTPKITNPVGSLLNPKTGGKTGSGTTTTTPSGGSTTAGGTVTNQELPVPTLVMGSVGDGSSGGSAYGSGGGGFYGATYPNGSSGSLSGTSSVSGSGSGSAKVAKQDAQTPAKRRAELAANEAPSAQLPIVLAILAIVALSLVTATYARLFLLRRNAA